MKVKKKKHIPAGKTYDDNICTFCARPAQFMLMLSGEKVKVCDWCLDSPVHSPGLLGPDQREWNTCRRYVRARTRGR